MNKRTLIMVLLVVAFLIAALDSWDYRNQLEALNKECHETDVLYGELVLQEVQCSIELALEKEENAQKEIKKIREGIERRERDARGVNLRGKGR